MGKKVIVIAAMASLLIAAAFGFFVLGSDDHADISDCGPLYSQSDPNGPQYMFPVKVETGEESCDTALGTLRTFMIENQIPDGWVCFRGHGQDLWAATCARPTETDPEVVIRAYNST